MRTEQEIRERLGSAEMCVGEHQIAWLRGEGEVHQELRDRYHEEVNLLRWVLGEAGQDGQ